jgi:hypothetical protein
MLLIVSFAVVSIANRLSLVGSGSKLLSMR